LPQIALAFWGWLMRAYAKPDEMQRTNIHDRKGIEIK
jgi:hypothetical protein